MISEYITRKRRTHFATTAVLVLLGVASMGFGTMKLYEAVPVDSNDAYVRQGLANVCEQSLMEKSFDVSRRLGGNMISVSGSFLHGGQSEIYEASLAIQDCVGYELRDFCMGIACEGSLIGFTLERSY